jgi:hypothetical protein
VVETAALAGLEVVVLGVTQARAVPVRMTVMEVAALEAVGAVVVVLMFLMPL